MPGLRLPLTQRRLSTSFSSGMVNFDNLIYMVTVHIGTPPQAVLLQVDTGSSDVSSSRRLLQCTISARHNTPMRPLRCGSWARE